MPIPIPPPSNFCLKESWVCCIRHRTSEQSAENTRVLALSYFFFFPPLTHSQPTLSTTLKPKAVFTCRQLEAVSSYLLHAFTVQVFCSCHSSKIVRLGCCLENIKLRVYHHSITSKSDTCRYTPQHTPTASKASVHQENAPPNQEG